jgi:hypothetical protein
MNEPNELNTLKLAAISTACIQNTEATAKYRISAENRCWTQAYADVCVAVDREMRERHRAERAESAYKILLEAVRHDSEVSKRSIELLLSIHNLAVATFEGRE